MAYILTSLQQSFHHYLGWSSDPDDVNPQTHSLLLKQPLDILFQILDFLLPEYAVAVALTCKLSFRALFPSAKLRLTPRGLQDLLLLLEESLSRHWFFCHGCTQLHRFSPSWAPGRGSRNQSLLEPSCRPTTADFGDLVIGSHHVRLVMNAHLFGPGHGISLSQLEAEILPKGKGWEMRSETRILDSQLFLRVEHRLRLIQNREQNRRAVKTVCPHHICHHVITHQDRDELGNRRGRRTPAAGPRQVDELKPLSDTLPCDSDRSPGSCSVCLTDYITTVVRQRVVHGNGNGSRSGARSGVPGLELLDIMIVSYHLLGRGRSPFEWEWRVFTTQSAHFPSYLQTRAQRQEEEPGYAPGEVRRRWDREDVKPASRSGFRRWLFM
ncbi:hypothetical protein F4777DRAFT_355412 [Nemania sp. FL0916]|nr:hypothetical protein F4777DRAFT_355412 [Nemania sp. FL0916]